MPVTARLSKLFYDRLGEEVTNELVDWFNAVDATYRADLRELNELNFARFDAKLEQRVAGLEAKLEKGLTELRAAGGANRNNTFDVWLLARNDPSTRGPHARLEHAVGRPKSYASSRPSGCAPFPLLRRSLL